MAFENKELDQMIALGRTASIETLIGALCVHSLGVVTDLTSDMLHDPDYVRSEGIPNLAKIAEMAVDQVVVVFPDMVADNGELDNDLPAREGENPFQHVVRLFMDQILKQRISLTKLEFQPR